MQVWIERPQFHQIGAWTTQASKVSSMNMQASVQKRKRRNKESRMGGTKQAWQATWGKERVCIKQTEITRMHLTSGYT